MKNYHFNNQIGLGTLEEDKQEIKKILYKKVGNYIQHIVYLTTLQIKNFEEECKSNTNINKEFILVLDYSNLKNKKKTILFLQKTKSKK